jgi:hypothetical protein
MCKTQVWQVLVLVLVLRCGTAVLRNCGTAIGQDKYSIRELLSGRINNQFWYCCRAGSIFNSGTAVRQVKYSTLVLLSGRLKTELCSGTAFRQLKTEINSGTAFRQL